MLCKFIIRFNNVKSFSWYLNFSIIFIFFPLNTSQEDSNISQNFEEMKDVPINCKNLLTLFTRCIYCSLSLHIFAYRNGTHISFLCNIMRNRVWNVLLTFANRCLETHDRGSTAGGRLAAGGR